MGNSPSKNSPSSPKSKSFSEYEDCDKNATPTARNAHRRTRSARVVGANDAPPPSYSAAIASDAPRLSAVSAPLEDRLLSPPNAQLRRAVSEMHAGYSPARVAHSHSPSLGGTSTVQGAPQARSNAQRAEELRRPMRQNSVEDALVTLKKYDTVIVVDDSGSMQGARWSEAREALATLADIASKYDSDGIDVTFLNDKRTGKNMTSAAAVRALFDTVRPHGYTPIGEKLESLLLFYLDNLENNKTRGKSVPSIRPVNYIVITDGIPTDDPEDVIVTAARRLDRNNSPLSQVGIQFVQIGDSKNAAKYLEQLDNALQSKHDIRDIVDTTPYVGGPLSAEMLIKILLGGINRRVDRRGGKSVMD